MPKQLFYFDCFALLADEWTYDLEEEPSEPEGSPELIGFFSSEDAAMNAAIDLEKQRFDRHRSEWRRGLAHLEMRQVSYFVVSLKQVSLGPREGLSDLESLLIAAAKQMTCGVGGAALSLPAQSEDQ